MALFQHPNVKSSMSHANLDASQHVSVMMCEQACGTSRPTTARGSLDCACPSAGRHVDFGANMRVASDANAYPICDVASVANAYPICDVASETQNAYPICDAATVANAYPICDVA